MYKMHGWVVLHDVEEGDAANVDLAAEVRTRWQAEAIENPLVRVDVVNACFTLSVLGQTNHFGPSNQAVYDLLRFVTKRAPASYGALYVWDDEDTTGFSNSFQLWVIKRGQMLRVPETHLSPCRPEIED
jgi:hypothetical protein